MSITDNLVTHMAYTGMVVRYPICQFSNLFLLHPAPYNVLLNQSKESLRPFTTKSAAEMQTPSQSRQELFKQQIIMQAVATGET